MASPIPSTVPVTFAAGDTLTFQLQFSDYPADSWTLSFYLQNREPSFNVISFSGTNSGGSHLITVAAAVTAVWPDSQYEMTGEVRNNSTGEQHEVYFGFLQITPNLSLSQQTDTRSTAKKILDFIDASWLKVSQKQAVRANIEGVQFEFRNLKELQQAREYWAVKVSAEDAQLSGRPRRSVLAVFSSAQPTWPPYAFWNPG